MSVNIKSPLESIAGKGTNKPSNAGTVNGLDGYQKRTSTPNGPDEVTIAKVKPGKVNMKTPATESNGRK